jgi:hypothetical protein
VSVGEIFNDTPHGNPLCFSQTFSSFIHRVGKQPVGNIFFDGFLKIEKTSRRTGGLLIFFENLSKRRVGFPSKIRILSPQKRLILINTVSCERGIPADLLQGPMGGLFLMSEVPL